MYYHSEKDRGSAIYHDVFSYCVDRRFHHELFERAVQSLLRRHSVLRTSFRPSADGRIIQLVHRTVELRVHELQLTHIEPDAQDGYIEKWLDHERHQAFSWTSAPLLRVFIHLRGPGTFQYSLSFHHAILDGWSVATLQTELFSHYHSLLADKEVMPPAPIAQYRTFIARELQVLASDESRRYWQETLEDCTTLPFPFLSSGSRRASSAGVATHAVEFVDSLSTRLVACARQLGVSVKTMLLAAHVKVMSACGGQQDVLIGVTSNGRIEEADGDRVLGLYLNSLPLRLALGDETWSGLILRLDDLERNMLAHRHYPLQAIQQLLGRGQLFQTSFNFVRFHVYRDLPDVGVRADSAQAFEQTSFPFVASFSQALTCDTLGLSLLYDDELLSRGQIERIAGYYHTALLAMIEHVDAPHRQVSLLSDAERRRILVDFNATQRAYSRGRLIHELIEAQAGRTPDAVAVVDAGRRLTYGQLNARADQLARYLRKHGAGPDKLVGICMERGHEMVVGLLGVLKSGAAYLPLDSKYPLERLRYMVEDAAPVVLLSQARLRPKLPDSGATVLMLDTQWNEVAVHDETNLQPAPQSATYEHLAYVIYTSGSTGRPKGVMVEHGGLLNYLQWALQAYMTARCGHAVVNSSFAFDATITSVYLPLLSGGSIHMVPDGDELDGLVDLVRQPTAWDLLKLTPAQLNLLAGRLSAEQLRGASGVVVVGGEPLPPATAQAWLSIAPGTRLVNEYGPTETVVGCCTYEVFGEGVADSIPIGRPIANTQIYILDEHQEPVPLGVSGEIYIGGAGVARGYLNQEELTAQRFVRDPFSEASEARMYKTGDVGRWREDGHIEYLGRNDFQVKLRGFRIELGEIEAKLGSCAGVREAVVIAREESAEERRLVAYVVMKEGAPLSVSGLREELSGTLPEYMVPSAFVELAQLPLTANGKLDRQALPAPDERAVAKRQYEAPQGEVEGVLAQVWQELLGLAQVGRHDHFFELGGHSLLVISMIERLRQNKLHADVRTVFTVPTLAELAATLRTGSDLEATNDILPNPLTGESSRSSSLPIEEIRL